MAPTAMRSRSADSRAESVRRGRLPARARISRASAGEASRSMRSPPWGLIVVVMG